ncbi:S-adenosyl-L-methionine-dependent methyltransferase [Mycena epipterygia]|nr:S-adenosyl-L-methionine-dependent methyltransferase [Mycena epipterygia]
MSIKFDYSVFTEQDCTATMEEITGVPAQSMLLQAGLLPTPPTDAVILDNACGGGVVTALLFGTIGKTMMCASSGATWRVIWYMDAQAIPFPDNHFTRNLRNFGVQVIPDTTLVVKESFCVLQPGGKLGITIWTSPGWLKSFITVVPGLVVPPVFVNGPMASKESITSLLSATGFTHIDVQLIKFEHTDSMSRYLRNMKIISPKILAGEAAEKYEAYMVERYGEGEFKLTWQAFVITADKP